VSGSLPDRPRRSTKEWGAVERGVRCGGVQIYIRGPTSSYGYVFYCVHKRDARGESVIQYFSEYCDTRVVSDDFFSEIAHDSYIRRTHTCVELWTDSGVCTLKGIVCVSCPSRERSTTTNARN
jgi:hypothetical protein